MELILLAIVLVPLAHVATEGEDCDGKSWRGRGKGGRRQMHEI